ncbi:hypothetical protein PHISP_01936 [Aspergillus sp. HF37]|nr:hypothetical protein PHISP_01936 [Aspergillus sp. HF37]
MSTLMRRSRRNRNSTHQSVDLLNAVNTADTTSLPRPRIRKLNSRKPFAPKSDDVYDVPSSSPEPVRPSKTRGAVNSAPDTRRSTRIQHQHSPLRPPSTRNSNKRPRRKSPSPEIRIFSDESDPVIGTPDQASADTSSDEVELPQILNYKSSNGDQEIAQDAVDDAYDYTNHEDPMANGLELIASEDESEGSSAEEESTNEQLEQTDLEKVSGGNNHTGQFDTLSRTTNAKRKLSDIHSEPEAISGWGQVQNGWSDENREDPESESSSDSGEESASSPAERSQKQPSDDLHPRLAAYVEIPNPRQIGQTRTARNQYRSPRRNGMSPAELRQHDSPPPRDSRELSVQVVRVAERGEDEAENDGPAKDGVGEGEARDNGTRQEDPDRTLFKKAKSLGNQQENWEAIFKDAKYLQKRADVSMSSSFDGPNELISGLQDTYERMRERLSAGHGISSESIKECENLQHSISTEAIHILDTVWRLSNEGAEDRAQDLLYGFETLIIPQMAHLIGYCFLAYYVGQNRFPKRLFHRTMTLLRTFGDRISDQIRSKVIRTKMLSKKLHLALRKLISALDSGSLNLRSSLPSRINRHARPSSLLEGPDSGPDNYFPEIYEPLSNREWTEDERKALVEGLRQYQGMFWGQAVLPLVQAQNPNRPTSSIGPDRYVDIIGHYGARFRDRRIRDLRSKAREVRDNFLPAAGDILESSEGRRRMRWLLDV